ncbi:MAG TPA: hypothetical protein VF808_08880 [Ktedonobacterales bacterium]
MSTRLEGAAVGAGLAAGFAGGSGAGDGFTAVAGFGAGLAGAAGVSRTTEAADGRGAALAGLVASPLAASGLFARTSVAALDGALLAAPRALCAGRCRWEEDFFAMPLSSPAS